MNARKYQIEMIFEQMFEQYTSNRISQIFLFVATPANNENPNLFRVVFDETANFYNRMPAQIIARFDRCIGEYFVRLFDCLSDRHDSGSLRVRFLENSVSCG